PDAPFAVDRIETFADPLEDGCKLGFEVGGGMLQVLECQGGPMAERERRPPFAASRRLGKGLKERRAQCGCRLIAPYAGRCSTAGSRVTVRLPRLKAQSTGASSATA